MNNGTSRHTDRNILLHDGVCGNAYPARNGDENIVEHSYLGGVMEGYRDLACAIINQAVIDVRADKPVKPTDNIKETTTRNWECSVNEWIRNTSTAKHFLFSKRLDDFIREYGLELEPDAIRRAVNLG